MIRLHGVLAGTVCLLLAGSFAHSAGAAPSRASLDRGATTYFAHCAMCHGIMGAGDGPLAQDLGKNASVSPARLDMAQRARALGRAKVRRIIEFGGGHAGRSNLMPPWGEKLGAGLVDDVTNYVMTIPSQAAEDKAFRERFAATYFAAPPGAPANGRKLFVYYCTLCHGPQGKGDGTYAPTVWTRDKVHPRNLTDTAYLRTKTDQDLYTTISLGGAATGKSSAMPPWNFPLTQAQIKDIVSYLRVLSNTHPTKS